MLKIQKIKVFRGLDTTDDLDINDNRTPDCSDVIVNNLGELQTRPGFVKVSTTAEANPIVGIYDFTPGDTSVEVLQTFTAYSPYMWVIVK